MIFRNDQPDLNIPDCSYPEFALSLAGAFGDRPAFVDGPSGRSISYRELADRSRRIAAALSARGMKKGDVFGIWLPNLPEYPPAFYGVIAAGGVVTTVSPLYTPAELVRQLKETGARYLLTLPQLLEGARAVLPEAGLHEVFALGEAEGATPYAELSAIDAAPPRVEIDPKNDPAVLPCSSGTTGMPKAVMLTHRNLMANALQVAAAPVDGGWMRTGDIGFADEGENCVIVDRLKELIKYKGYQVAPAELEGILLQHPNVADACVIPLADAEAGEVPKAFVVTKGEVGAETLLEFVAGKVAPYKRVRALEFVDALPRSLAGKLLRRVLVERERSRPRAAA